MEQSLLTREEAAPAVEPPAPRRPARWPLGLALLYLALVCGVGLASRVVAERFWLTTILLYFPQAVYLAPAALTVPVALLWRDVRALAVNATAVLLVLWVLMGYNVPPPRFGPPAGAPRVRVLAYNIRGGTRGFSSIAAQIDRYAPDVVVFSEASGWSDDLRLQERLAQKLPGWNSILATEVYIASRWPFAETEKRPLGPDNVKYQSPQREAARVRIQAPFGTFQVLGAHFYTSMHGWTLRRERRRLPRFLNETAQARRLQADEILDWTREIQEPTLLAGDFNTPPTGHIYRDLLRRFGDSFRDAGWGWGYTYPSHRPLLRIDYIFHSPHWTVTRCETGAAPGSDHRPVFAELALTP